MQTIVRPDIEDPRRTLVTGNLLEQRQQRFRQKERRFEIDRHDSVATAFRNILQRLATDRAGIVNEHIQIWLTIANLIHEVLKSLHRQRVGRNRDVLRFGGQPVNAARDVRVFVFRRGSSEKEQPLRLRKVAGLSPALGSNILQF